MGFVAFHLLRGPEHEDHVLYSSHTMWKTQEDFILWTKSGQFRAARQRLANVSGSRSGIQSSKGLTPSRRSKIPIRLASRPSIGGGCVTAFGEALIAGARLRAPWLSGLRLPYPNGS